MHSHVDVAAREEHLPESHNVGVAQAAVVDDLTLCVLADKLALLQGVFGCCSFQLRVLVYLEGWGRLLLWLVI